VRATLFHDGWSELGQERPAFATGIRSPFEVGCWEQAEERLSQLQNETGLGIGLGTEATSRYSSFLPISRTAMTLSARVVAAVPSKIAAASTESLHRDLPQRCNGLPGIWGCDQPG
jgi:hypothetical protein